ncbi:MAG: hypothetical protein M5U01_17780 [Ardenticatenaceae bacterium]|nr:hypothetical protein [Ardenticatenaceae bacterium]
MTNDKRGYFHEVRDPGWPAGGGQTPTGVGLEAPSIRWWLSTV